MLINARDGAACENQESVFPRFISEKLKKKAFVAKPVFMREDLCILSPQKNKTVEAFGDTLWAI
jgi:hypothetical protein